mmetsp:Transcript_14922/g.26365  ORF Transcript_14922/g.26365 Transcript_14922/m.26365 type:complete len:86 (-) Transcript_14922:5769-6026(-)
MWIGATSHLLRVIENVLHHFTSEGVVSFPWTLQTTNKSGLPYPRPNTNPIHFHLLPIATSIHSRLVSVSWLGSIGSKDLFVSHVS